MLEDELLSKIENIRTSQPEYYEYFLKYNGVFMNPKEKNALVLEMESGCCALANILEAGKVYTCGELLYVLPKLVEGFSILEENGIANRDVKPENIILVENREKEGAPYYYKISDFGVGCYLPKGQLKSSSNSVMGLTKSYAAPEVFEIIK